MSSARDVLLAVAFRHAVRAPNAEEGFEQVQRVAGVALDYPTFQEAITACVREGLLRDPVCLPEGALQCHWRLELTPTGVAAARAITPPASR